MQNIPFYKYQGTGNDFIMIDNRERQYSLSQEDVAVLCHRRMGIGADGLILLESSDKHDFKMVYYNADGRESTMCGNGGRCIVAFAKQLNIIESQTGFEAVDGLHYAHINAENQVELQMKNVETIRPYQGAAFILDTGSPHIVYFKKDVAALDVYREGYAVRHHADFEAEGINVNFAEPLTDGLLVRTFERGVEDETLSCGTGVTASAIASSKDALGSFRVPVRTPGGNLEVRFNKTAAHTADNIWLCGLAQLVFEGLIKIRK